MSDGVDIKRMWELLNESNAESMQLKMFRNEGDEKPFRAIIFIEGEEAVAAVDKFLTERGGEGYKSPRIKVNKHCLVAPACTYEGSNCWCNCEGCR